MSWSLVVLGCLGMVPVAAVAVCSAAFGAGLPLVLVVGMLGQAADRTDRRATPSEGRADGGRGRSAA